MTIDELLESYRKLDIPERERGAKFERLMKNFMLTYPVWRGKFSDVWLWHEFPFRGELGNVDLGIDIVAKTVDGDFWAVQCKFYADTTPIDKDDVSAFIATSNRTFDGKKFSQLVWISTSDNFTENAEETLRNQTPPVTRINLATLREAEIDWEKLDAGKFGEEVLTKKFLREYQQTAVDEACRHFATNDRGRLIMACGTGKTFTALKIAEALSPDGKILFLVPSITLVKQTLVEWAKSSDKPFKAICVCSDETAANKNDDEIRNVNLPLPPTTDPNEIADAFRLPRRENFGMTVVFSTYQSLDKVAAAQKIFGDDFDLIICDEAHRTTGSSKDKATQFTFVHDNENIRAKRRLYMTATPRMYNSDAKTKATVNDITLWSMDDENIYGREFYRLNFGDAVDKDLLADYKVIVLTVNEKFSADKKPDDDTAKINGCINALSKKMIDISRQLADVDPSPMHTAVAFCPKITASKAVADTFNTLAEAKKNLLDVHAEHVDGTMDSRKRDPKLHWLKSAPKDGNTCRILTNVRCLSEGVDVPALDAVIFMSSKKSKVEIVQAVGRVMRKAPGKKYGYIIIPVVVPLEKKPEDVLSASATYGTIWDVLNALRAHDRRVDIFIEEIKLNGKSGHIDITHPDPEIGGDEPFQLSLDFGAWKDFLYARMVEHVGNRRYWEQWAKDVAQIAERHTNRINELIFNDKTVRREFYNFVYDLQQNLNPAVKPADAVEMLSQHMVSRPVFEAIFENYSFVKSNPVSQSLEKILALVDTRDTDDESDRMKKFYDSVRERCRIAHTPTDKQKIIIELYEKFFRVAVPKAVEKLGIVYTPVEVVDFILRSVDAVLHKHFDRRLTDRNVHVIDPFTGTGTFITRLIESGLIKPRDLERKYRKELHANEIVLLAYYIAAVNIENAFAARAATDAYTPFDGICFTDTFQLYELGEQPLNLEGVMQANSDRVNLQKRTTIKVIVGNPPYSVGQRSASDNNPNQSYDNLEARIADTYAKFTNATNKNSLYDSYIKAFRWASDRLGDGGVIGFVTNAGWLDGAAMDGLRKCFAKEFSAIYVFNLRGNQRTQGEMSRREGGKIFGSGSRAPIAITILVKDSEHHGDAQIFYRDIGDYLTREEKLARINATPDVLSGGFEVIVPNDKGDWINQRGNTFDNFIALAPEKKFDAAAESFFVTYSNGLKTQRDTWCYNFSRTNLLKNAERTINAFNAADDWDFYLSKDIVWTRATKTKKIQGHRMIYSSRRCVEAIYRPFCKEYLYYDTDLNEMIYQIDKLFPNGSEDNRLICVPGISGTKKFSVFITDKITDLHLNGDAQCFPLYWYKGESQIGLFTPVENQFERRDGITDWILRRARELYGKTVTKADIFYYVYGFLHLPKYREKFSSELKKSLPRIFLVDDVQKFWQLSKAGRALAELHLNYEGQPAPAGVEVVGDGDYHVTKLRFASKDDRTTLIYNDRITIRNIPPRSFDYVVNGRSPLEWIIDRYQIKTDKASGLVNDANAWGIEHDNPRYVLDLILSCLTVSLKTLEIVDALPEIDFDA